MAKQINSTSTKIEKSFGAAFFEKLKRHAVEYSGTSLMVGGLACCFKSIADQTMVKIAEGGIVNLLAETNMMRFGLSVSTLGMTAFVIGQLLNDRREQREKLEKSREAMESLKNSLLHDKSPDLALFLRGEGYKVNLRREFQRLISTTKLLRSFMMSIQKQVIYLRAKRSPRCSLALKMQ